MTTKISPLFLLPPVLFFALAAVFFFGMNRSDPDNLPSALQGQIAPGVDLTELPPLPTFDETILTAPGVKLVNYWASWCAPCRVEHPNLEALAAEGVPIYGINYKDDAEKALRFLEELGNPYVAVGADGQGRTALNWGVYGVPETYVIDSDGRVVLRFPGPITGEILRTRIRPAMDAAN